MEESPINLSGLSLWLSEDDMACSEPLPTAPAPSRNPTNSLNHLRSSGCCKYQNIFILALRQDQSVSLTLLRKGDTTCTNSERETISWLNKTKHLRKFSYTSVFFRAFRTLSKNANSLSVP